MRFFGLASLPEIGEGPVGQLVTEAISAGAGPWLNFRMADNDR
jgi:hypothetical protein